MPILLGLLSATTTTISALATTPTASDAGSAPTGPPFPLRFLTNPQTLNLYSMVSDDPESFADLDGHCPDGICANITTMLPTNVDKQAQNNTNMFVGMFKSAVNAVTSTVNNLLLSGDAGAVPSRFEIPQTQPSNERAEIDIRVIDSLLGEKLAP